ncbi:MAG: DNA polymerase III subunit beta [Oscillospiraceae bacterium]|nr:DNA polymerase III subunit beta [Oscillospiraceae bacterium]
MKFSCEKYLLQAAVTTASRCTASKSPIPALEGILIQAGQDVKLTGYDLKKGIYTSIPADVAEPGSIILGAKIFGEIVRSLPDDIVTITTGENFNTSITCGAADFSIMGTDSEEYPELPFVNKENAVSVSQGLLSKMIRQTIFSVSTNESRPVYTGALMEIKSGELTMVAVDGFRLALRREVLSSQEAEECSFIVPGTALSDVEKLCGDEEDTVEITVGAKHISFSMGETVLVTRRLEGEFLNYRKSIPSDFSIMVEADRNELVKAVSRVSLIIDEKTKHPLRLILGDDLIKIFCTTGVGRGEDQCLVQGQGGGLEIGFNNAYLLDALRAAPADKIRLCFNNAASPCVIVPTDGTENFSYMILPVRLKAGV